MLLSQWALLGFLIWTLLLVVFAIEAPRLKATLLDGTRPSYFDPTVPHGSERYRRGLRAHANCLENLPVFAGLVLLGGALGLQSSTFQLAAISVLPARVLQSVTHLVSGHDRAITVRFLFFKVQLVCFIVMAACLLQAGLR